MKGKGKYGMVQLVAVRAKDNLEIKCGTASSLAIGRSHAELLLAQTSAYSKVYVRDSAGHRLVTVMKQRVGERQLG